MRTVIVLLSLSLFAATPDRPKPDRVTEEMKKLEGCWVWKSISRKGFKAPVPVQVSFTFGLDGSLVQKETGQPEIKCTYKVNPAKSPGHIDISNAEGKLELLLIYELKGETLRLAALDRDDPAKERPRAFDADDAYLWYLKREIK